MTYKELFCHETLCFLFVDNGIIICIPSILIKLIHLKSPLFDNFTQFKIKGLDSLQSPGCKSHYPVTYFSKNQAIWRYADIGLISCMLSHNASTNLPIQSL